MKLIYHQVRITTLLLCISAQTFCMESNILHYQLYGTEVRLIKGSIYNNAGNNVDTLVVGRFEQCTLNNDQVNSCMQVGFNYDNGNTVYIRNKDAESASDDDTYQAFNDIYGKQLWNNSHTKEMNCKVLTVIEPRIVATPIDSNGDRSFGYRKVKIDQTIPNTVQPIEAHFYNCDYYDDKAIEQATKDLARCYKRCLHICKALREDASCFNIKIKDRSIALPTLGASVGIPRQKAALAAITTIIKQISKHKGMYSLIELYVEKRSDFDLYKFFLDIHTSQEGNINAAQEMINISLFPSSDVKK